MTGEWGSKSTESGQSHPFKLHILHTQVENAGVHAIDAVRMRHRGHHLFAGTPCLLGLLSSLSLFPHGLPTPAPPPPLTACLRSLFLLHITPPCLRNIYAWGGIPGNSQSSFSMQSHISLAY